MLEILKPDGTPANGQAKVHEPLHFRKLREQLDQRYAALLNGYLQDMTPAENSPNTVEANAEAIRAHYGNAWEKLVQDAKLTAPAMELDGSKLYTFIDAHQRGLRLNKLLVTPMQELAEGLVPFDFELLGTIGWGDLWLAVNNSHWVAVAVNKETGVSTLWQGLGTVPEGLQQELDELKREPLCRQPSWTMAEVRKLLAAMRWQRLSRPEPQLVQRARKQRTSWLSRRWN